MHEFPVFQAAAALLMKLGLNLETASRLSTLIFFFMGAVVLYLILKQLLDRGTARWAVLCYLVSPFNIIYSRTGLIDFTAQFFVLGSVYASLRTLRSDNFARPLFFAILSGLLGALVKCFLWFVPAGLGFLYCAWLFHRSRSRAAFWLCVGLVFQCLVTIAWIFWTGHIRGEEWNAYVSPLWIFGTLEQRLDWRNWIPQFRWIARFVLNDWMILPFIAGLAFSQRSLVFALVAVILLPIVVLFNSSQHHDYYLISQVPYIFTLVGIGWTQIFRQGLRIQWSALAFMLVLFTHSAINLRYYLGSIAFDYHTQIAEPLALKAASDPEDRIYLEGFDERFDMPLYAERLARPYYRESMQGLNPTLLVFKKATRPKVLSEFMNQWVESLDFHYFITVRVKGVGSRQFDPRRHIGLMSEIAADYKAQVTAPPTSIDLCAREGEYRVYKIGRMQPVSISFGERSGSGSSSMVLSGGEYLHLPAALDGHCRFEVALKTRPL